MVGFRWIETFYWVVTLGSFGKAARKLNTTQPAVSHRIAALESALGVKLLTRSARQVVPTARGRELLIYSEKLLGLRSELISKVGDGSGFRGVLRLGVTETLVHTWLSSFVKALNHKFPKLTVEIEVDITAVLRERLLAQQIELALLLGPLSASVFRNQVLCNYRVGFLASPALGIPNGATLLDFAEHAFFTFQRQTSPYESLRTLLRNPDAPPITLNASTSLSTIVRLAIDGLGVAVIPPAIVQNELRSGALIEIESNVELPELAFSASWLETPDTTLLGAVADLAVNTASEWPGS